MSDFDQHHFTAQAFIGIVGMTSLVAASMSGVSASIDAKRIRDQDIIDARLARARSRVARRRAEMMLESADACAELRRAYAAYRQAKS
jgi:hypothetical protein